MCGKLMGLLRGCSCIVVGYFFSVISMAHFAVLSNEMRTVTLKYVVKALRKYPSSEILMN